MKFGYFYAGSGKEGSMKKRRVNVNLWDDYRQKPEYDVNDPTAISIETDPNELKPYEMQGLRSTIFSKCLEWKKQHERFDVSFMLDDEKEYRIVVFDLDEPTRKDLFDFLRKSDASFSDIGINWLMES